MCGRLDLKDFIAKFCRIFPKLDWDLTRLLKALSFSLFAIDKTFSRVRMFIGSTSYESARNDGEVYTGNTKTL